MKQDQGEQTSLEAAEPESVGGASPGEQLKAARLALGLSISDVSSRLKLSIKKIESLENDDVENIATPVFVAGYLRTYARLLELPEDDVLAGFDTLPGMKPAVKDGVPEGAPSDAVVPNPEEIISPAPPLASTETVFEQPKSVAIFALIALLAIAVVYFFVMGTETDDGIQTGSVTSVEPMERTEPDSAQLSFEIDLQDADSQENAVSTSTSLESVDVESVAIIEEAPSSLTESTTAVKEVVRVAADETGPVDESEQNIAETAVFPQSELRLVFSDESWVDVMDARGEKLVYRLAKAGLSRTVTGVAPFDVQLGYAPAVEIFYNGQSYDMSRYAGRRSARFRVGHAGDRMTNE